jgi:hypothetical protein
MPEKPRPTMTRLTWSGTPTPASPSTPTMQGRVTSMSTILLTSHTPPSLQNHRHNIVNQEVNILCITIKELKQNIFVPDEQL